MEEVQSNDLLDGKSIESIVQEIHVTKQSLSEKEAEVMNLKSQISNLSEENESLKVTSQENENALQSIIEEYEEKNDQLQIEIQQLTTTVASLEKELKGKTDIVISTSN